MPFYGPELSQIHRDAYESSRLFTSALLQLLRRHRIRSGTVVDLGCGAGGWARELSRRGYNVTGIDRSPAMIRLARRRVPRAKFVCGSMVTAPLPRCDVVTGLGEPLNYLTRRGDVRRVFRRVHSVLRPGGLFLFDATEPLRSRKRLHRMHVRVENNWAVLSRVNEDPLNGKLGRQITWVRKEGKRFRHGTELHHQTLYPGPQLARWLRQAGFRVRLVRRIGRRRLPPNRVFVVAQKI